MPKTLTHEATIQIVDAVLAKVCHDLINPVGTAQMALEQISMGIDSNEILASCLQQTIDRLEIFRSLFRANVNLAHANDLLKKYIANNDLHCVIEDEIAHPALMFFLLAKMASKSSIKSSVNENGNEIICQAITIRQEELNALNGKCELTAATILPYLARISSDREIIIEQLEEKTWKIIIK